MISPRESVTLTERVGGKVVGKLVMESLADDAVYVSYLVVEEAHQNKGIGSRLIQRAVDMYRHKEAISLHVETVNEGAVRLYRRHGFFVALANNHKGFDTTECRKHYLMVRKGGRE